MHSNIVHQYFKKELPNGKVLVKVNPIHLTGAELRIENDMLYERALEFEETIFEDLAANGFVEIGSMEFNLYQSGLA
jgi:hypothetical protein